MAALPHTQQSYKELYDIIKGALRARIMLAGLELGLFDCLDQPASARQVAGELGLHPLNTARVLDALATIGLLAKREGNYRNSPLSQAFLRKDSPTYVGDLLRGIDRMASAGLTQVPELVRNGPPPADPSQDPASPELWAQWARAGAQWALGEMGQTMAGIVSGLPGFADFRHMLDLGGGHGIFTLYIIDAHPSMRGAVMDRAPVLEAAEEFSRRFGLGERFRAVPGDYIQDDIGEHWDLIFASATLNFAKDRIDELFGKIYRAIKQGGYFISFQEGMTHENTQPDTMLGHLLDSLKSEQGFSFKQGFLAEAMLRAGFRQVSSRSIDTPMGVMDLDIARR